jgi:SPP1 gp7 family putative phage head morphogenesis protein
MKWEELPFEAAISFLRGKSALRKDDWLRLDARARLKAFTVAGVARQSLLDTILAGITRAVAEGQSFDAFRKAHQVKLEREWQGTVENPSHRVEVIFRTNVQTAYAIGRWEQQRTPEALSERPYGLFSAIMDRRTSEVCRACHGKIIPFANTWWNSHYPPLHFQCRSTVIALSPEQAAARGGLTFIPPEENASPGFGTVLRDWNG